jgi:NADPH-dependent curcumin reductase CurA
LHARIVLCGARSQYNVADDERYVIKNYTSLIIIDYLDHALEGLLCLNRRVDDGKIIQEIDMQHGFDQIPSTLTRLFTGANLGKQLLKVLAAPLPLRTSSIEKTVFKIMSAYAGWRNG